MSRVRLYSPIRFAVAESSLRPLDLSTAASSSRLLLVNSWLALLAPCGVHDRHQVVGAEAALDELLGRHLHALRSAEARVQVVDHHHVDAPVERSLVRLHVGLDRGGGEQRPIGALDGNVHQRERADRLGLAVLEDLEIFLLQVADVGALLVGDDDVDLDVVDLHLEGRGLRRLGRGRLTGGQRRAGKKGQRAQPGEERVFMGKLSSRL